MARIAFLENTSIAGKIMLLLGLILICTILTAFSGLLIGKMFLGVDMAALGGYLLVPETDEAIAFTKFYQLLNQLGVFILPAILFSFLVSAEPMSYLRLKQKPKTIIFSVSFLIIFTILPFVNYLEELNQGLQLPQLFSAIEEWMSEKEQQAAYLTEVIIKTSTFSGLLLNLSIVALIPAIGEELLFRGVLLKLLKDITKNPHWAVIISAALFSAFHLQFYGFLPRFALGLVLGYLFVITNNLWVPIFVHFINNAAAVIVFYLHYNGYIKVSMEDFGALNNPVYIIGSILISLWLISIIYKKERFLFQ
ncbi:MAG: CPBP family intramembrane metalloprotease [Bacteroidetes bacterium]|nr:CPBP family intramembrane metalloprotease [Bacteroidota bacterium]